MGITEAHNDEKAALDEMVQSAGWAVFMRWVQDEYGPGAQLTRITKEVDGVPASDPAAQQQTVREVLVAARAVTGAMEWPRLRVKKLSEAQAEPPLVPRRA